MSIDQLQTLLRERAEVHDRLGSAARVDAVRGRVRETRRRRRAIVAVAAVAAVVAAGASVVPLGRQPAPNPAGQKAPAVLAGRTVPRTQTAAGFSYHYVEGVQSRPGAERLRLHLTASSRPRLVMWASSSTNYHPVMALRSSVGPETYRSAAQAFWRYALVSPGEAPRLALTQRHAPAWNRLALAVFALDRRPPPGISNGVVTFRKNILDDRLVGGLIGEPGQTDLYTTIEPVRGRVRISDLCYGAGSQDYVHVSFNGVDMGGDGCTPKPYLDPGVDGGSFTAAENPLPTDGPLQVHVWLSGENGSAPSATSHAVIGFGLYRLGGATFSLAGQRLPDQQEYDGHIFAKRDTSQSIGARELTYRVEPYEVPRLVTTVSSGHRRSFTTTELLVNGRAVSSFEDGTGGGSVSSGYVIQPGEAPTLTFRLVRGDPRGMRLGIVLSDEAH